MNPIAAQLKLENKLPKKVGAEGEEEVAEVSEERIRERRRQEAMRDFEPCRELAARIQNLEAFVAGSKIEKRPVRHSDNAVQKLAKTFEPSKGGVPQSGFFQKQSPQTQKLQKAMIAELTKAFQATKPVQRSTPPPASAPPRAALEKQRAPASKTAPAASGKQGSSVTAPKVAGLDYRGMPSKRGRSPPRAPNSKSLIKRRIEQLQLSTATHKPMRVPKEVRDDLFFRGRKYSLEELPPVTAPAVMEDAPKTPAEPATEGPTPAPLANAHLRQPSPWTWLNRTLVDSCGSNPNDPRIMMEFNTWYRGRLQVWAALYQLREDLQNKRREASAQLATLETMEAAYSVPASTDVPGFDFEKWSEILESARRERRELQAILGEYLPAWLKSIDKITKALGAQNVYLNRLISQTRDRQTPMTRQEQVAWTWRTIQDRRVNESFQSRDVKNVVEGDFWRLDNGVSPTARLWSAFLTQHRAEVTLSKNSEGQRFFSINAIRNR